MTINEKKPRRDNGAEINNIEMLKKHLGFNIDLLAKADASYELFKKFFDIEQKSPEQKYKTLLLHIVDAFVTNCVMYTTRLIDKREEINIYNTVNNACKLYSKNTDLQSVLMRINCENDRIDRLCAKRDKAYGHTDIENISGFIDSNYPLYQEDLDMILDVCFDAVNSVCNVVGDYCIGGRDLKTKKRVLGNTRTALHEVKLLENQYMLYKKMYGFMKENHKNELLNLIYKENDS